LLLLDDGVVVVIGVESGRVEFEIGKGFGILSRAQFSPTRNGV
jgi:hypothetical protein